VQQDGTLEGGALTKPWAQAACRLLLQADSYLADWDIQQGWVALQSAHRMLLQRNDTASLSSAVITLRREVDKIPGWRAAAIKELLGDEQATLEPNRVIAALSLRDDEFNTTYFKILLRRHHLFNLFLILIVGIGLCLLLTYIEALPPPFTSTKLVAAVALFGSLGAAVSVAQGLLASSYSAKIPAQQIGAFVVWMRPVIGACLALVALIILYGNESFNMIAWDTKHTGVILAFAFLAGFSERFIVGAVERIWDASDSAQKQEKKRTSDK
jgi:hypothetical protein